MKRISSGDCARWLWEYGSVAGGS